MGAESLRETLSDSGGLSFLSGPGRVSGKLSVFLPVQSSSVLPGLALLGTQPVRHFAVLGLLQEARCWVKEVVRAVEGPSSCTHHRCSGSSIAGFLVCPSLVK